MSPIQKSLTALAAAAMLATVGYATAQSTDAMSDSSAQQQAAQSAESAAANNPQTTSTTDQSTGATTTTTTTTDTSTQTLPAPPTGVIELAKPKNTVMPDAQSKQPNGTQGMENNLMTTGLVNGVTRPSIGDHATPPIPAEPTVLAVTTERTTTTTTTPAPQPEPQPVAAAPAAQPAPAPAPEPAVEPMPAPRADRN